MNKLDRRIVPPSGDIHMPNFPEFETQTLPNGATLVVVHGGEQPIVKVDIVMRAGSLRADRALVARATIQLLNEGTQTLTSRQIAEKTEFYGAYIWGAPNTGSTQLSMMCLQKDTRPMVELLADILYNPIFPENELQLLKSLELQRFEVDKLRTPFVCTSKLQEVIYKAGGRYGRHKTADAINALSRQLLLDFYNEAYRPYDAIVCVSGQPSADDVKFIAETFGVGWQDNGHHWSVPKAEYQAPQRVLVDMESEQTSINMSRPLFGKNHEDYFAFGVVDTILGGYISSRLMQNLREKLGLTYGISSSVMSNVCDGLHQIRTEVRRGSHEQALQEIQREMLRLCEENVSATELDTVRSAMLGDILRMFNSPMASAEALLALLTDHFTFDRITNLYNTIKQISADEVRQMAQKWLVPDAYTTVIVGKL